ncbi:MAG: DinB family protein [Fibrella sp.]|nr:DinB family protein [Armatimonadota bacterium]
MSFTIDDTLADMKEAREDLKRHIATMPEAHWDAKPLPHCNSIRQIFVHLLATDRGVLAMLKGEPFEINRHTERHDEAEREIASLSPMQIFALHDAIGDATAAFVDEKYGDAALDTPVTLWGSEGKIAVKLGQMCQHTAYHVGQVSLIRQEVEPDWDYFKDVFGVG